MRITTFNDIRSRRQTLAKDYLDRIGSQPGLAFILTAPWHTGKTSFLGSDLIPLAEEDGMRTAYIDLWLHRQAPLEAMIHPLERIAELGHMSATRSGDPAKTKVSLLGAGLGLAEMPRPRALPTSPLLRLEGLASRLVRQRKGKCLLILDEAHTLADVPEGEAIVAALRSILHKYGTDCFVVLTTSAPDGLTRLARIARTDIHDLAQVADLPALGDDYLHALADHFHQVHPGKMVDIGQLREAFRRLGHKPALLRDIVRTMASEGVVDVESGIDCYLASDHRPTAWASVMRLLDAFDQAVLIAIAHGHPPLGQATIKALAEIPGVKPTTARVRSAVEKLKRCGLVSKTAQGMTIDDPLFSEYLRRWGADSIPQ